MSDPNELAQDADHIEGPRLEGVAHQTPWRRLRNRTSAGIAVVAASAVAVVLVGTYVRDDRGSNLVPAEPSRGTSSTAPSAAQPNTPETTPRPAYGEKVWPVWDPRDVDQLPRAPRRIAPAIPRVIDPPASSALLSDDPMSAAVLAVERDGVAQVLGTDGDWRTVPIDGRYPILSLSPDGTRLSVCYYFDSRRPEHDYGVRVYDLTTGGSRALDPPSGFERWDDSGWSLIDEERIVFNSGPQIFVVTIESGESEELTIPAGLSRTLDPAGNWLASADFTRPNILTDYKGGTPREVSMDRTGRLSGIQADEDTVVGTTYDDQPFSVVVADRKTLTPQFRLPVRDPEANYSNWGLAPAAIAQDGSVIVRVAAIGRRVDGFRLVAWHPESGELSIVSTTSLSVEASVVFAQSMLRAVGPG